MCIRDSYQADIFLYRENDTEKATPVYETSTQMTVSGFRGAIPDITQWIGHSGNMQMLSLIHILCKNTGYKSGKWHDVTWYEKALLPYEDVPAEMIPIGEMEKETIDKILASF